MEIKLTSTSATSAPKKVVTFLQSVYGFNAKAATSIAMTLTSLSKEKLVNTSAIDSFLSFARSHTNADIELATRLKSITDLKPILAALAKAKTFEATLANVNNFKFSSPVASTKPSVSAETKSEGSVRSYLYSIVGRYANANGFDVNVRNVGEFLSNRGEYNESVGEKLRSDLGVRRLTLGEHEKVLGVDCIVIQFNSKSNAFLISDTRLPRIAYKGTGKILVVEAKMPTRHNGEVEPDATTARAFTDISSVLRHVADKKSNCGKQPDCRWG